MSKTKHPNEFRDGQLQPLDGTHFEQVANTDRNNQQAAMTYMVNAKNGTALGSDGGTLGYGKEIQQGLQTAKDILFRNTTNPDIAHQGDMGLLTRQVASYRADQYLGLNSVAEERFGMTEQGKVIGISMQAPGCNVESNKGVFVVDCSDPRIQRGLSDLQISDYITGQTDRHAGNIFIDPITGKVTGIDNDLAFSNNTSKGLTGEPSQKMVKNMPLIMHEETRAKILAADPEKLRELLSQAPPTHRVPGATGKPGDAGPSSIPDRGIKNAVDRLIALQKELQNSPSSIKIVSEFNKATYQFELEAQDVAFKKEVAYQQNGPGTRGKVDAPIMGFQEYAALDENAKAGLDVSSVNAYVAVPKTSYLGAVEMAIAKNRVCAPNLRVPEHQTTIPMKMATNDVTEQLALENKLAKVYQVMDKGEKKVLDKQLQMLNEIEASPQDLQVQQVKILRAHLERRSDSKLEKVALERKLDRASQGMDKNEKKSFDEKLKMLNKIEAAVETKEKHLDHPSLNDRIRALYRGTQNVHDQKESNMHQMEVDVKGLRSQLNQSADLKLKSMFPGPVLTQTQNQAVTQPKPALEHHESLREHLKQDAEAHEKHQAVTNGHQHVADKYQPTAPSKKTDQPAIHLSK